MDWFGVLTYALVVLLLPGSMHYTSAVMSTAYGRPVSRRYAAGIASSFLILSLIAVLITVFIARFILVGMSGYRYAVVLVLLWTSYRQLRVEYSSKIAKVLPNRITSGLAACFGDYRVLLLAFIVLPTYFARLGFTGAAWLVAGVILVCIGTAANVVWYLYHRSILTTLDRPLSRRVGNLVIALLLVVAAVDLSGIVRILQTE